MIAANYSQKRGGRWLTRREIRALRIPWLELGLIYGALALIGFGDLLLVKTGGYIVVANGLLNDCSIASAILLAGIIYAWTGRSPSMATLLFVVAALIFGGPLTVLLNFATAAWGRPFIDDTLSGWDHSLGLHWTGYERWFTSHPWLSTTSGFLYSGSTLVVLVAFFALAWTGRLRGLTHLALALTVVLAISIVFAGFYPATGPYHFYGLSDHGKIFWVDSQIRVVTERPRLIVLNAQPPFATFPSFHASLGLLVTVACWRIPRFGIPFGLFNLFWMMAVPVWGSHYFVNMIAGGALALLSQAGISTALPREGAAATGLVADPDGVEAGKSDNTT